MLSKLVSPKVTNCGRPFQLAPQTRGRLKCSVPDTDPTPAPTTPIQSIPNPRVRPTHILRQPARPLGEKKETILVQIEEDHQDVDQFEYVQQKGNWQGHNIYLKQLLVNKNYAHAFDYWKTLRKFGPTPDTLTYNTYFALVEVAGSPYDIIDTFYDFDEHNILRVQAQPDATSYAFLIKAHCTLRNLAAALDVLQRMADLGIAPVQRSFAMILDLCADQALFEEGRVVLERVKAEIFENESVNQSVDIEVMNSVMFFLGSHNITEGEKYFHSIIRAGIQMSYNTYQRLIELYLKANRPQDIARIVHLMKNDGFTPNAELTKYTLMEAFIETGDKAILNSITSTYPKPTFQREQHYKFFYDFISKYIAGGGPVYIPEGFLDIATPDELEQLYVQVIAREVGVIPHVGEQLDSYGRTTVDLNELLSEDDIDDQLEPQEEENDINEIMEDKKNALQLDIDDEDSHFERLEEEIWSGKPARRDEESSYSYDYGSDNYSEQVSDEAAANELNILPSGKNYMEDSDQQDYDMTNEDESRDSDEEERRSSEGGSSDIGLEPEELWADSKPKAKRASGSSARARNVLDATGEDDGEAKSDGGSQQAEALQQATAQDQGDEVSEETRQAALTGAAEFEEDFDDLLDFGEGGDGGGPDGGPIDDVEEERSEGADDLRSRPWRRRKAKAPHMPKLEDSDPFDAENDFHRDEPDARYLEILRQLEVSPEEFAARKEKELEQEWKELDEMSDENPDVFQRGVYSEALVQQSTELYNILDEEDIKEVALAIKESQDEEDRASEITTHHASPKDVIKTEWENAVAASGQSTPDAVFGGMQYEYQSAVESLQAVESDYARRKAALDKKREAEGAKKTVKTTGNNGNAPQQQQDASESSSEGEFAYDRESVSDEAEVTPSLGATPVDRVFTADYLFPAKLNKQTAKEAKEFRQRFEAVPGYDPIAQQIDDNSIGGMMANPGRIDKMAKPSIKEPTESEIDKAHVRRMYLTKIKKRYEEAKAKGASKVELLKIREVFNQVKQTRVTQQEVDDFDSKMELYEHHLKHENPKKYKELHAMYLMDTKRDSSGFDDPVLSAETGHHPMEVMEAQMSAIDDFYVDAEMPHDDNVFIDAVRQFDHRNPEDPDMKRLVLRWGKNVQEMNNTDLDQAYQRTRMASINVLMPNQPQRKWTGNPDDIMWNLGDDSDDHNYL